MRIKTLLTILFSTFLLQLVAQNKEIPTSTERLFNEAKEYYTQEKYGVSYHYFELFLQQAPSHTQPVFIEEAEYYLATNAYKLRKKDADEKLERYWKKYPYTPHLDETLYMMGILAYEKQDYETSLKHFKEVIPENLSKKQEAKHILHLGYAFLKTNRIKKARNTFNSLKIRQTPYSTRAQYYAGYSEYLLKNYNQALKNLLPIENNPEFRETAPYYITQIYFAQKNFKEVNKRSHFLLKKYPENKNNAEIYRMLGEQYYMNKKYRKAIENLAKYEKLSSKVIRKDIYYLGTSYLKTDQPKKAIECLSKVTTQNDEMSENAYLLLGNAFVLINDKNNARMSYQSAIKTHFNNKVREQAMYNYALTTYESELGFGESIRSFESFIKEFPNSKHIDKAYNALTTLYLTSNNFKEAYQSVLKIKKLNKELKNTKQYLEYNLGTEAFMNKDYKTAINYFSLGKQTAPNGKQISDILYWRSESYYKLKKYGKASEDLVHFFKSQGVNNNPNYTDALYSLGYTYFAQKQYTKALPYFLNYLKTEKNRNKKQYTDAKDRTGDIYFYNRDFAKADQYYQKASNDEFGDYSLYHSAYIAGLQKNYKQKIEKLNNLLKKYPNSEYTDDALYEIGRSYIMLENNQEATKTYKKLIKNHPHSKYIATSKLETGLIYFDKKDYQQATPILKQIIEQYPTSEESQTAFETLETIAIDKDEVKAHLEYAKKIGRINSTNNQQHTDSILFLTAEKQYLKANYNKAIHRLKRYLKESCPTGKFCSTARFYLAESYYQLNKKGDALKEYIQLIDNNSKPFVEKSALKTSEIYFDRKKYTLALQYFKKLDEVAQTTENKDIAETGILRSAYLSKNDKETLKITAKIITNKNKNNEIQNEALLYRANILLRQNNPSQALKDLREIKIDTRTTIGAEAKYLISKAYDNLKMPKKAEQEIMSYAEIGTPHAYWLAKSFILLSDIYIKQNNDFQAKQYLLSLQKNYPQQDEIQNLITKRLNEIAKREKEKIVE